MSDRYELLREFKTAQFRVLAEWTYDDDADLSWDDTGETARKLADGEYVCMVIRVRVLHTTLGEIGVDHLGGCIYATPAAFMDHKECAKQTRELRAAGQVNVNVGSYFSDMVSEACRLARLHICSISETARALYVRQGRPT